MMIVKGQLYCDVCRGSLIDDKWTKTAAGKIACSECLGTSNFMSRKRAAIMAALVIAAAAIAGAIKVHNDGEGARALAVDNLIVAIVQERARANVEISEDTLAEGGRDNSELFWKVAGLEVSARAAALGIKLPPGDARLLLGMPEVEVRPMAQRIAKNSFAYGGEDETRSLDIRSEALALYISAQVEDLATREASDDIWLRTTRREMAAVNQKTPPEARSESTKFGDALLTEMDTARRADSARAHSRGLQRIARRCEWDGVPLSDAKIASLLDGTKEKVLEAVAPLIAEASAGPRRQQ